MNRSIPQRRRLLRTGDRSGQRPRLPSHAFVLDVSHGIYDTLAAHGLASVGVSSGTAFFTVNNPDAWYRSDGSSRYAATSRFVIFADCGGSNSNGTRAEARPPARLLQRLSTPRHGRPRSCGVQVECALACYAPCPAVPLANQWHRMIQDGITSSFTVAGGIPERGSRPSRMSLDPVGHAQQALARAFASRSSSA